MAIKIIKNAGASWRQHRFPPLSQTLRQPSGVGETAQAENDPAALQRAIADGFQEGVEKGFSEGLAQGHEAGHREGLSKGFEEGVQQGRQQGHEQGLAEARENFAQLGQLMNNALAELDAVRRTFSEERRKELLELVQKVAKQVIRMELTLHPNQLLVLAEEALAAMPGKQEEVRILLNPEEYARIKDLAPEAAANWRLVPDDKLGLGECRVVTAHAEADVGCQQRLESCMDTLAEHMTLEDN
ncbi:flagellar assembly protein FliH [Alkalilimnicola ehrlichii]|uniref:Flagellar assembly protein FliH n=1 Tax=Alkalilimnicola ehrlichii TaxID=351052 RepID=A0A3E0X0U9_9GAMM|nr:flagellar assembly protein FliH [Alkalilimnicola ehrlichii]RFA30719.1 flagellar assembly protein FliH [Alkalilimnicola ehrlichii]RFA38295.1 flagellar assembly protein FliH [Alkalilimnicola ehrlichii]